MSSTQPTQDPKCSCGCHSVAHLIEHDNGACCDEAVVRKHELPLAPPATTYIDESSIINLKDLDKITLPKQVKGKIEYHTTPATDSVDGQLTTVNIYDERVAKGGIPPTPVTKPLDEQIDEIKTKILNESVVPKRERLVEELAEKMYKKGFKEAEALITNAQEESYKKGYIDGSLQNEQ